MNISSAFIARPIATSLLMPGFLLVGAAAYPLIPVAPLPQVDFPTILVTTQLPGASPEIMASSVTQPLERQFGQIPGVTQMTSSSALGNSAITVQFDLARNIDGAAQDIQTAINAASGQLPKNLPSPPTYRKVNPADSPILVLALTSDTVPLTEVDDYAETILDQHISQISGVANVKIGGQQKPAVRIQIDPSKVASFGPSPDDPRLRRRRSIYVAAHHRSRRGGHIRFPAQPVGDNNPERRGAAGARRHFRGHVRAGLQP